MKKILTYLAVIILAPLVIGYFSFNSIVKSAIESQGSKILGAAVTVKSSSLSLLSGEGTISGLTIANPDNYKSKNAATLDTFHITLDVASLFTDTIIIRELRITAPRVYYELSPKQGLNINELKKNAASTESSKEESRKKFIIDHFMLSDAKLAIISPMSGEVVGKEAAIPDIELHNIGRSTNGFYPAELARKATGGLINRVSTIAPSNLQNQIQNVIDLF